MPNVKLHIGGREYEISCAEGDEQHLETLAALVHDKVEQARHVAGDVNEARQLLFASIFMADELIAAQSKSGGVAAMPALAPYIDDLTTRIDTLVQKIN